MMILGYCREDFAGSGILVPIKVSLKKQNNLLVCGKSGSGKSLSARWYIWQMLKSRESRVYIADYKGGEEYEKFEGSHSYSSGAGAIKMIEEYYQFFTEVRNRRVRLTHHVTLFIEEYFGILTFAETQSKKLKTELMAKVGELLAVSRGLNIGVSLCLQRIDASNFSAGSREQFQTVISFGRCSQEQFRMAGFSGELEGNPTAGYKPGEALVLMDGQAGVEQVIVPFIRNADDLCQDIRFYLDRQPSIQTLTRATAGSRSAGQ